jgi:hypothetical protein
VTAYRGTALAALADPTRWESAREGVGGGDGWPLYLQRFAELFGEAS